MMKLLKLSTVVIWHEEQVEEGIPANKTSLYERNIQYKDNGIRWLLLRNIDSLEKDSDSLRVINCQFKTQLKTMVPLVSKFPKMKVKQSRNPGAEFKEWWFQWKKDSQLRKFSLLQGQNPIMERVRCKNLEMEYLWEVCGES